MDTLQQHQPQQQQQQQQHTVSPLAAPATSSPMVLKQELIGTPEQSMLAIPQASFCDFPLFPQSASSPQPSLNDASPDAASTVSLMTPKSQPAQSPDITADLIASFSRVDDTPVPEEPTPAAEKKQPPKKRKSWGQVLPEPKTNLPPRKRAKTEDEKEQRRVERVLRNRRAAQSSRERKRQETEALERRNKVLEAKVGSLQRTAKFLLEQLRSAKRGGPVADIPALDLLASDPTLSLSLFGSTGIDHASSPVPSGTINPSSLSPIAETAAEPENSPSPVELSSATPPPEPCSYVDVTQHPAEVLCEDLQCQSTVEPGQSWMTSRSSAALISLLLTSTWTAMSLLTIPAIWIPFSIRAGWSIPPTRPFLIGIIAIVSRPKTSSPSTSTNSSQASPRIPPSKLHHSPSPSSPNKKSTFAPTLRSRYLRKILTCSPGLARPLTDATLDVLRLVTKVDGIRVAGQNESSPVETRGNGKSCPIDGWVPGVPLPSREVLMTLLWTIRVEEHRIRVEQSYSPSARFPSASTPRQTAKRQCREEEDSFSSQTSSKRQRVG